MHDAIEAIRINRDMTLKIYMDDMPINWRKEGDPLGTMVCWYSRYNLGDIQPKYDPSDIYYHLVNELVSIDHPDDIYDASTKARIEKQIKSIIDREFEILPLYLYDHSGITIACEPFSCRWDSGQVGYIYIHKKRALEETGIKAWNTNSRKKIREMLKSEVSEYDNYLTGRVYGYTLENRGDTVDSCWGFYGNDFWENGLLDSVPITKRLRLRVARTIGGDTKRSAEKEARRRIRKVKAQ